MSCKNNFKMPFKCPRPLQTLDFLTDTRVNTHTFTDLPEITS